MARASTHSSRQTAVWCLTLSIAGATALGWGMLGLASDDVVAPIRVPWPYVMIAFAVAETLLVHFEFRKQTHALTLGEVPLLVGVVFCSPVGLLAARLLGSVIALVGWFRQSRTKLAFNLAIHGAKVVAAVGAYHAVLGHDSPVSARGWIAAFVASGAADLASHVAIISVITLTAGRPSRGALQAVAVACAVAALTNTSLALLTVVVLWYDAPAAGLLAVMALVFAVSYRAHSKMRRRYANLELLYQFTASLGEASSEPLVLDAVLRQAAALLGAEDATLAVMHGGSIVRHHLRPVGLARSVSTMARPIEDEVLATSRSVLAPRADRIGHETPLLDEGMQDAVAVPISLSGEARGVLVVANRSSEVATFERDDRLLLEALGNHAAVALRGSRLLEQLRDEVASKEHQALHDQLTGLANRTLFFQRVGESLAESATGVAVMLMDLDRFKEINDTLGHFTGDQVLKQIAGRLVKTVGERGTVARLGGDEFAIVGTRLGDLDAAVHLAEDVRASAQEPLNVDGLRLEVQASIGIAMAPEHGDDPATLLQRADVAMYDAKSADRSIAVYTPETDHYTPRRLTLAAELRAAISNDQLELYYQPQVSLVDGSVIGVEALLRWNHAENGFIPPDEFIPVAENCGLIAPLTSWVLDNAIRQLGAWRAAGTDLAVAVNVSARSMLDPMLVTEVDALLTRHGVPADRLVVELTETSIMTDLVSGEDLLHQLARTGATLSIDDFGTGYSSLARLARLPVNEVKIDRSFVSAMLTDPGSQVIVRSTIDLARNLGLRVIAEGVEDHETWSWLADNNCDVIQGYVLTRPLPAREFEAWLAAHEADRAVLPTPVASAPVALMQAS